MFPLNLSFGYANGAGSCFAGWLAAGATGVVRVGRLSVTICGTAMAAATATTAATEPAPVQAARSRRCRLRPAVTASSTE
jgi:hypothetical protein